MLTVLVDGVAYGMLLFILACGLSVTMGLMNFINLAHGAFAMVGGYVTVIMLNDMGVPFLACLPAAFVLAALAGVVLERTLYVRLYKASHLDQVMFTIGLVFIAMATADYFMGAQQKLIQLPEFLRGRVGIGDAQISYYRLFIVLLCGLLAVGLQFALTRTRFGAQLRAAVDDGRVARGLGIDVSRLFAVTFAVGSGLAGLGGALGVELLGLDPTFAVRFMIYFLIVVAVGGTDSIVGPFLASLLLGIGDVAGKYYVPGIGSFIIYAIMVGVLIVRPQGLFARR
ncbi:MAG: branched-chain amino acid ABC transporter permease [Rhodospirillales bacterium]|nr:branched-chain amino acid ABC transporter permease [Rhodospirillales bacterium]